MAENASPAFLLWAEAAHSGAWRRVLDLPLTPDSWLAARMLRDCKTFEHMLMRMQAQQRAAG